MRRTRYLLVTGSAVALAGILAAGGLNAAPTAAPKRGDPAVEEARLQVRLLTALYREAITQAHETWVRDGVAPAATVIKRLFPLMEKKGWPRTQWLSVNGQPVNPDNAPRDKFEERAARAFRRGETMVEEVQGDRYRAVLNVPFTGSCYKCHPTNKPLHGQGGLSYFVPLRRNGGTTAPK